MYTTKTYVSEVKFCAHCGAEMLIEDAYSFDRQTGQKLRRAKCSKAAAMTEEELRTSSGTWEHNRHDQAYEKQGGGWEVSSSW